MEALNGGPAEERDFMHLLLLAIHTNPVHTISLVLPSLPVPTLENPSFVNE